MTRVAVRRLHRASQPERQVLAVTRPALSSTAPVRVMLAARQTEAAAQHEPAQPS